MDITDYINFESEIDSDRLFDVEQRIRLLMREKWPELDTTPSSPFGNLVLTPIARVIALFEQSADCILGDLNLENALNSIVCDCSFVENFLKGLGLTSLTEVNTTATIRLTFNKNQVYSFDQSFPLLFNNEFVFNFIAGKSNPTIQIKQWSNTGVSSSGSSVDTNDLLELQTNRNNNIYQLSASELYYNNQKTQPNQFFVDIPIYGPATASITAGTDAALDEDMPYIANIVSAQIIEDVEPLTLPTTIAELAKLCQSIQPSSNLTTRAGVSSYVFNKFPKTVGTSAVISGDDEMKRNTVESPFETVSPYLDIYVKGSRDLYLCTEIIPSDHFRPVEPNWVQVVSPWWHFQHIPIQFTEITCMNGTEELSTSDEDNITATALMNNIQTDTVKNLNLTENECYLLVPLYPIQVTDTNTSPQGKYYLKVSYLYDPLMEAVQKTIESPACCPVINTLTRPFYPFIFKSFTITYRKETGKFFDRQAAIDDIYNFINSFTYPLVYDDAYISDIMISNGASGVDNISSNAVVSADAAQQYVNNPTNTSSTNTCSLNTTKNGDISAISNSDPIKSLFGLGTRNVQYILKRENINLVEKAI